MTINKSLRQVLEVVGLYIPHNEPIFANGLQPAVVLSKIFSKKYSH